MSQSDLAISVRGVSKDYTILHGEEKHTRLAEKIMARLRNPWHRPVKETFHALTDLNFDIKKGEVVGIIGRNGAGKSTLLKILSRITEPTAGEIRLYGRVASLLEVGTGFHPELTGRENIYLNGAILGMRKVEIDKKFDEIVAFSEVEKFLDTPVKRYSSGMYVRLAFAVAAHLEPEILIVDEVLSVGDAEFQKKCLGKMKEVSEGGGRTVLFVSHNMAAVQQLTSTAVLLVKGRIDTSGETAEVLARYQSMGMDRSAHVYFLEGKPREVSGLSQKVEFVSVELDGCKTAVLPMDGEIAVKVSLKARIDAERLRLGMTIFKIDGTPVGTTFSPTGIALGRGETGIFTLRLHDHQLAPGNYYFGMSVGRGDDVEGVADYDIVLDVLHFELVALKNAGRNTHTWNAGWGALRLKQPELSRVA